MKYIFLLLMSGCGVNGHVDPITINPVQVEVSTAINYNAAQNFCLFKCNQNQQCANTCYNEFLQVLGASMISSATIPTPTPTN